uniref:Tripartite motif-containing protein 16-like n=1 Tax=Sinocyclocheilus grahami TaxID=75366 RepID=A0A672N5U6_SINGR
MAEARFSHDQFRCPVCLELLKDPVTIPCGHSYCRGCITGHWNQEDQIRFYSCPECRQTFRPRPVLKKSTMLAEVVEQLKKSKLQTAVPAGPGDVEHDLIDATGRLQEMICHQHEKLLDIYCQTDKQCICMACMVDEHKSHETVSAAAERTEKQRQLDETRREFQQQIQEREQKLQELKKAVKTHKRSAQTAVEDSERIFTELISSIERRRSEVTQMIRDREKTVVSRAEALMKRLTQDIGQLRRSDAELQQLSQTHNHTYFLQVTPCFPSLPVPPGSPDVPSITDSSLDVVGKSVAKLRQKLEDFCREEIEKLSGRGKVLETHCSDNVLSPSDFFQFTLDPNTAHQRLFLSQENRVVTYNDTVQEYPNHPERFSYWWQVLCRESVSGRCYWEVEWSGIGTVDVCISVSYKSINRKGWGYKCKFGSNDQSWSLICSPSSYTFCQNNKQTELSAVSSSRKIGVYVDHKIGILSFYSVSDTMTLIHRVQTTFTQPLYPGFWINLSFASRLFGLPS